MSPAPLNAHEFRAAARRRLPRGLFEYIDRGSEDETALDAIARGLAAIRLVPRILRGQPAPDPSTEVFGRTIGAPLIVAPTALAGLVARDGEIKLARAAARHRIPFTVSTQSISTIEDIRAGAPDAELWFSSSTCGTTVRCPTPLWTAHARVKSRRWW